MGKATTPKPPAPTPLLQSHPSHQLHKAISWALDIQLFKSIRLHRNTHWTFPQFILLTLFWVWSECDTLTAAFQHARQLSENLLGKIGLTTYQGLMNALTIKTSKVMPLLRECLQHRMADVAGTHWRIGQWLPLAVDGSRTTTPRTRKNEVAFNRANFGKGRKSRSRESWKNKKHRSKRVGQAVHPQIWLTLLWHMCLRMPWSWRCGPSYASERTHLTELLDSQKFPEKTLFCGDAGFVGYELWKGLIDRGHSFLVRVGSNVHLLRRLCENRMHGDIVYAWPDKMAKKKQPPLKLRLLKFRTGRCEMFAVTNVLEESSLTRDEAKGLYQSRWGVEVQFRALKQTFGRGKLRSRTPERAYAELEWSIMGLWLIQMMTVSEQIPAGIDPDQSRVSVAVQVVRDAMRGMNICGVENGLRGAVKDKYIRKSAKGARYRPKSKDKPSAGKPKIKDANKAQRDKYRRLFEIK